MAEQEFTTQELESEIWRPVPGYEGIYSASSLGRIRRDAPRSSNTGGKCKIGRILKPATNSRYLGIKLTWMGVRTGFTVHAVIARTFLGPCPPGKQINHIDGVRTNCRIENLEYLTPQANRAHARANHLYAYGERNPSKLYPERQVRGEAVNTAKLTESQVIAIRSDTRTRREIATAYRVCADTVWKIRKRIYWKHLP